MQYRVAMEQLANEMPITDDFAVVYQPMWNNFKIDSTT